MNAFTQLAWNGDVYKHSDSYFEQLDELAKNYRVDETTAEVLIRKHLGDWLLEDVAGSEAMSSKMLRLAVDAIEWPLLAKKLFDLYEEYVAHNKAEARCAPRWPAYREYRRL